MVSLKQIADEIGVDADLVRNVLMENITGAIARDVQDKIFDAARKLGYNLKKLKVGKRMAAHKQTVEDILYQINENDDWSREDIVRYLESVIGMVERVQARAFREEYGAKK